MKTLTDSALQLASRLIDQFGPRPPGSRASRDCAEALAKEALSFTTAVETEEFTLSPGAFLAWIRLLVAAYAAALILFWLKLFAAAAVILVLGMALLVAQFFLYREVIDPFMRRRTGKNVSAVIEPEGDVRGELIISGHHDSARIFNFLVHQPGLYGLRINGGMGALVALALTSLAAACLKALGIPLDWTGYFAVVFTVLLGLVGQLWFFASPRSTPGAGDNLVSSTAAWEFLRHCAHEKDSGRGLRHLRIRALSFDAEEAGLRGSRAWRKARLAGGGFGHPVWNLNLECLYDPSEFFFLTTDINGSVPLSEGFARRCAGLLEKISGRTIPVRPIAFLTGGTDAGETARAGAEATTLMGMPWSNSARSAVYHTPADTVEAVSSEAVTAVLELADRLARELDGELVDGKSNPSNG
jgi:aminopeptidase YwaD